MTWRPAPGVVQNNTATEIEMHGGLGLRTGHLRVRATVRSRVRATFNLKHVHYQTSMSLTFISYSR
jgi:hypothetical protein